MPDLNFPLPPIGLPPIIDRVLGRQHHAATDMPDVAAPKQRPPTGQQGNDPVRARHAEAAKAGYGAIQSKLVLDGSEQLTAREHSAKDEPSTVWPHGQLVAATLDRALITGDVEEARKAIKGLERYERNGTYNPFEGHGAQDRFYDDNAWIGLDFAQAFRLTGDQEHIDGARRMFDFLQEARHADGGLYWKENAEPMSRNAASNGPALQLALQLHDLTGEQRYLDSAKEIDAFMTRDLRRANGLVIDNVDDSGKREETIWSYNQGTAIGADLQLAAATNDPTYLERAKATANAALDFYAQDDRLWKQPPAFNAVFFRNLMQLDRVAPDPRIRQTLERYLERADSTARGGDGLYGGAGLGRYDGTPEDGTPLIDQSAFVQMHALLAMSPEQLATVS